MLEANWSVRVEGKKSLISITSNKVLMQIIFLRVIENKYTDMNVLFFVHVKFLIPY